MGDILHETCIEKAEEPKIYFDLAEQFEKCFGDWPSVFARVPGRVNLIGEHIDYCGFSVLPMAIEQDIIVAVHVNNTKMLNVANVDSKKYKKFSTPTSDIRIERGSPQWYYYFLCGYKGIAERYKEDDTGMDVLVKGTVPPSAGLSSSSALVCASALATAKAHRISLSKSLLAVICAESERYIGTQGGGMDQAIGFLAEAGAAKLIEFNPLRTFNVPLPPDVVFVVANSCVAMNKAATSQFNRRVIECQLAAKVLAKKHGLEWRNVEKLAELLNLLQKDISDMKSIVEDKLPNQSYSRPDLCSILEITDAEFETIMCEISKSLEEFQEFQLANRAIHVFEEAARVKKFKSICERGNEVEELGLLMNESHQSCRDLYECSHPILDELVQTALDAGAVGSRLTGAGWGGCCVSLVKDNHVVEFMEILRKNFYEKRMEEYPDIDVNSALFVTKPSGGAAVYVM